MAGKSYSLTPKEVPAVNTKFRKIQTKIPVPESIPILQELRNYEPRSMSGQPLVVWDRAEGCQVYDKWGNKWLDMSSGVLVTNAGHGQEEIVAAIQKQASKPLLHNYCFPTELRAKMVRKLVEFTPDGLDKAFLLTTGAETTECAIKLARTWGRSKGGDKKIGIISFEGAFHGRTMGSQMIGGSPALKEWIVNVDPAMYQVPFPDGYWCEDTSFDTFIKALEYHGITPDMIAGVISETYQGGGSSFLPKEYVQKLAEWCKKNDVLLIMDEVQAGFGRTGKKFGFMHYEIVPDLACFGKGISGGLPLSAIMGKADVMDQYEPGSMTSTHTGNPVCVASALANLEVLEREKMWENAASLEGMIQKKLGKLQKKYPKAIGSVQGRGLVWSLHIVKDGKKEADADLAFDIIEKCIERGLLFFSPVGRSCVKIAPPLCITEEQITEGIEVLDGAIGDVVG